VDVEVVVLLVLVPVVVKLEVAVDVTVEDWEVLIEELALLVWVDVRVLVAVVDGDVISQLKNVSFTWRLIISFIPAASSATRDSPVVSRSSSPPTSRIMCTLP